MSRPLCKPLIKRLIGPFIWGIVSSLILCSVGWAWVLWESKDFLSEDFNLHPPIEVIQRSNAYTPLDQFPAHLIEMVVASEDEAFFHHPGFSPKALIRAFWFNLLGRFSDQPSIQGGSTLTQQLAKNLYLTHDRTMERKIKELYLAIQLERAFSKEMIMELYFNTAYMGSGVWGIEPAALRYFDTHAQDLEPWQALMLVVTIQSPEHRNPFSGNPFIIQLSLNILRQLCLNEVEKASMIRQVEEFLECR